MFYVRYCEEQVACNDSANFRIEVNSDNLHRLSLKMKVELLFSDIGCSLD